MGYLKMLLVALFGMMVVACTSGDSQSSNEASTAVTAAPIATTAPAPATALPSFAVQDQAGNTINLQSLAGKKIFVNLWATWCPPCRAEMPSIAKLYAAADKEKTAFVLLSLDRDFETAKAYVQANNLNLPIYFPAGDLPDLFAVDGIPATFIFNEGGQLADQRIGSENYNTPAYRKLFGVAK
jgi:thiol-disulfide isomerase/thioredoxin